MRKCSLQEQQIVDLQSQISGLAGGEREKGEKKEVRDEVKVLTDMVNKSTDENRELKEDCSKEKERRRKYMKEMDRYRDERDVARRQNATKDELIEGYKREISLKDEVIDYLKRGVANFAPEEKENSVVDLKTWKPRLMKMRKEQPLIK